MNKLLLGTSGDLECRLKDAKLSKRYKFSKIFFYKSLADLSTEDETSSSNTKSNNLNDLTTTMQVFKLVDMPNRTIIGGQMVNRFESKSHLEEYMLVHPHLHEENRVEWTRNPMHIATAAYRHSGRYFCEFTDVEDEENGYVLVTDLILIVYDGSYILYYTLIIFRVLKTIKTCQQYTIREREITSI